MKEILDFKSLPKIELELFLNDTWCEICQKADLGIANPILFIEDGRKYVQGNCRVCGNVSTSEVIEVKRENNK